MQGFILEVEGLRRFFNFSPKRGYPQDDRTPFWLKVAEEKSNYNEEVIAHNIIFVVGRQEDPVNSKVYFSEDKFDCGYALFLKILFVFLFNFHNFYICYGHYLQASFL